MNQLRLNPIKQTHKPVGVSGVARCADLPTVSGAAIGKNFDHASIRLAMTKGAAARWAPTNPPRNRLTAAELSIDRLDLSKFDISLIPTPKQAMPPAMVATERLSRKFFMGSR